MGRRWFTVGLADPSVVLGAVALGGALCVMESGCGKDRPAAAEATTPTVTSPKAGESNFEVSMQAEPAKAGQPAFAEIVLVPKGSFHCNENYPYRFKLSEPEGGVVYPSAVVQKEAMSITPARGVMKVPFTASTAGEAKISGKFFFSVCTSDQCLIDTRELSVTVKVD